MLNGLALFAIHSFHTEPAVLFLDEPTTGLASAAAFSVVGYISKLAAQTGVVCIMTIHQVSCLIPGEKLNAKPVGHVGVLELFSVFIPRFTLLFSSFDR